MSTFFTKYSAQSYALMRIVAGFLFLCHGSQNLFGFPAPGHEAPAWFTNGAGGIEFFGGVLFAVGVFNGWAAVI